MVETKGLPAIIEEYEARMEEQARLAATVTCPKCGHKFDSRKAK